MDDEYEKFKSFTDDITGDKKQRDKLKALADGEDPDAGGPKKKKKKGKWASIGLDKYNLCLKGQING